MRNNNTLSLFNPWLRACANYCLHVLKEYCFSFT
jgi:hypothetical protein